MCGRFALYSEFEKIEGHFSLAKGLKVEFKPSYNIAPLQKIYVICQNFNEVTQEDNRTIIPMQWGLIPFWAKQNELTKGIINARLETVENKPSFKESITRKRCLIIANGFYEWKKEGEYKQPYFISIKGEEVFGFAGIWSRWTNEKEAIESCAILTIEANNALSPIHNRMPAIIVSRDYSTWLDSSFYDIEKVKSLAVSSQSLNIHPVSQRVNNFRYNQADCIKSLSVLSP